MTNDKTMIGGIKMIIIVEGPDGAGKTTLAEKISAQTKFPIEHRSKPKTEEEKAKMMEDYLNLVKSARNVILDRCWYSEMVYGRVMRDQSYIDYPQMYELEKGLAKHGALIIYCTGPKERLWARATRRGEDYITSRDNFNAICNEYDKLMNCPHIIPVLTYEYKDV